MSNALQDQLLKAGLVDKNKANQIKNQNYKKKKQQRHSKQTVTDESKAIVEQSIQEKKQRDQALNRERNDQAQQKAIIAQIKQLIDLNVIKQGNGDDQVFNFEDDKKIKRIFVIQEVHDALVSGKLAIVKFEKQYYIVPVPVADKISDRDPSYIILRNNNQQQSEQAEDGDDYAQYQVPDDLMW